MNQLLAGILLTLLSPIQLVMMLVGSVGAAAYGSYLENHPERYWELEIGELSDEAQEWLEFGTADAKKFAREKHIRMITLMHDAIKAKGITTEVVQDYFEMGRITKPEYDWLTSIA